MGIRDEQKEKRRTDILLAALDLFIRKGYRATKIGDIARSVGMSTGLLFHYFASKELLYEELIKLGISGPMSTMNPAGREPLVFFEETARMLLKFIKTEPFMAKMFILMGQVYYNESCPPGIQKLLTGFDIYTPTAELIRQGQENGTLRAGNPVALALTFWSAIHGIAVQIALNPDLPCPDSEWIVDIIRRQ